MKALEQQYAGLNQSSVGRYLPRSRVIAVEPLLKKRFSDITSLRNSLQNLISNKAVQGWLTCQSSTHLVAEQNELNDILESAIAINGELVSGDITITFAYDCDEWKLCATRISESQEGLIATEHTFAVDDIRFNSKTQLLYYVCWDIQDSEPVAVAQYLRHITSGKEDQNNGI